MASTYRRVRMAQAKRSMRNATITKWSGTAISNVGSGLLAFFPIVGGAALGSGIALAYQGIKGQQRAAKMQMRAAVISRLISNAQAVKRQAGATASISRARGTLAKTAAARSAAASRSIVPRPIGQRRRNNDQKRGDGQTEGYYRTQAGKRVFVRGYATPSR